jgi:hypothetical protein
MLYGKISLIFFTNHILHIIIVLKQIQEYDLARKMESASYLRVLRRFKLLLLLCILPLKEPFFLVINWYIFDLLYNMKAKQQKSEKKKTIKENTSCFWFEKTCFFNHHQA